MSGAAAAEDDAGNKAKAPEAPDAEDEAIALEPPASHTPGRSGIGELPTMLG